MDFLIGYNETMIYLGADHNGFKLKEDLKSYLQEIGYEIKDFGAYEYAPNDDYPDFIRPAAEAVAKDPEGRGIVTGFSGQGEAIVANKISGVRAVVYYGKSFTVSETGAARQDKLKDVIKLSREDNDANILSLAAGFVSPDEAKRVVTQWLKTAFRGEERHVRRLKKIKDLEINGKK